MALDEPKEEDQKFEEGELTFVIEKKLLESIEEVSIEFIKSMFGGRFKISPKVPFESAGGNSCGSCSC